MRDRSKLFVWKHSHYYPSIIGQARDEQTAQGVPIGAGNKGSNFKVNIRE